MPKPLGNKGIAPLLPTFVPEKGLIAGSVRYAVGPATYAAQGGVLPAQALGWDKNAEAVTAIQKAINACHDAGAHSERSNRQGRNDRGQTGHSTHGKIDLS